MKPGTIIAAVGLTGGVVALGYYGYTKLATPAAPAAGSLIPAGSNPSTGVQQYFNTAGDIVDAAGAIINSIKPVSTPGTTLTDSAGNTISLSTKTERGGYEVLVNGVKNGGGNKLTTNNGSIFLQNVQNETYRWNVSAKRWDKVPGISGLRGLGSLEVANMMG